MSVLRIRIAALRLTVCAIGKLSLLPNRFRSKVMTYVVNQIYEIGKTLYPKKIN